MATAESELLVAFVTHSVEGIRAVLDAGFDIRSPIKVSCRLIPPLDNVPNRYLKPTR